jgi:hypothetical protein
MVAMHCERAESSFALHSVGAIIHITLLHVAAAMVDKLRGVTNPLLYYANALTLTLALCCP